MTGTTTEVPISITSEQQKHLENNGFLKTTREALRSVGDQAESRHAQGEVVLTFLEEDGTPSPFTQDHPRKFREVHLEYPDRFRNDLMSLRVTQELLNCRSCGREDWVAVSPLRIGTTPLPTRIDPASGWTASSIASLKDHVRCCPDHPDFTERFDREARRALGDVLRRLRAHQT